MSVWVLLSVSEKNSNEQWLRIFRFHLVKNPGGWSQDRVSSSPGYKGFRLLMSFHAAMLACWILNYGLLQCDLKMAAALGILPWEFAKMGGRKSVKKAISPDSSCLSLRRKFLLEESSVFSLHPLATNASSSFILKNLFITAICQAHLKVKQGKWLLSWEVRDL